MAKFDISTPEGMRDFSVSRFNELAGPKLDSGQAEHQGILVQRVTFDEVEEEIVDLWHYTQAIKLKGLMIIDEKEKEIRRLSEMVESLKKDVLNNEEPKETEIEAPTESEGESPGSSGEPDIHEDSGVDSK